jgi:hypothetical protein
MPILEFDVIGQAFKFQSQIVGGQPLSKHIKGGSVVRMIPSHLVLRPPLALSFTTSLYVSHLSGRSHHHLRVVEPNDVARVAFHPPNISPSSLTHLEPQTFDTLRHQTSPPRGVAIAYSATKSSRVSRLSHHVVWNIVTDG